MGLAVFLIKFVKMCYYATFVNLFFCAMNFCLLFRYINAGRLGPLRTTRPNEIKQGMVIFLGNKE